jgi:hypothetical protein
MEDALDRLNGKDLQGNRVKLYKVPCASPDCSQEPNRTPPGPRGSVWHVELGRLLLSPTDSGSMRARAGLSHHRVVVHDQGQHAGVIHHQHHHPGWRLRCQALSGLPMTAWAARAGGCTGCARIPWRNHGRAMAL